MPKRSKDARRVRSSIPPLQPHWLPSGRSVTARLKGLLNVTVGTPYDRDPCPHVRRTSELVSNPLDPEDVRVGVSFVRRTDTPCIRPGNHVHETRVISAPDPAHPGDPHRAVTITVPDEAARLHADAAGSTWA